MNDSETEIIAEEEITQGASTQHTSVTAPEANLHILPSDDQSKKKENNKKRRITEVDQKSKSYQARTVSPCARNTTQCKWNSFPDRNIFFGDWPQRAARSDSWTINPLCSSEWKKLHSYKGRTESISWNKLQYGNQ